MDASDSAISPDSAATTLAIKRVIMPPVSGNWLSIEGAQTACSVALQCDGDTDCWQLQYSQARGHAEVLPQLVDRLLRHAQISPTALTGVIVCNGPGAFTGLRISVTYAQGLAFAWRLPVLTVSALAALSYAVADVSQTHTAITLAAFDARMSELYVGGYRVVTNNEQGVALPKRWPQRKLWSQIEQEKLCHDSESACAEATVPASSDPLPIWGSWLGDSVLGYEATRAAVMDAGHDQCSPLTIVGSGGEFLADLMEHWPGSVSLQERQLLASDLIRVASEQPHLVRCVRAQNLSPVYLRHAVAKPPSRLSSSKAK